MKLSAELYQEIISQLTSDSDPDQHNKRKEPRVGVRAQGLITPWTLDDEPTKATPVTIRDLSPAGICILSPTVMKRGARFILQLPRSQGTPLRANYEVRYCKPLTSNLYAAGGKLVGIADENASPKTAA